MFAGNPFGSAYLGQGPGILAQLIRTTVHAVAVYVARVRVVSVFKRLVHGIGVGN